MTGKEKITLAVMLVCLILWMLEKTLGISSAMVAVAGGLVLIGAGVFGRQEFRSKIAWDSMIFIGTFLCISDVFAALGINDAVKILLGDSLAPLIQNPWILIPSLCLLTFVIRFVVVSWTASAVLITTILLPPVLGLRRASLDRSLYLLLQHQYLERDLPEYALHCGSCCHRQ